MIAGAGSVTGITASAQAATGIRVRDNFHSSFLTGIVGEVNADSTMALARAIETLGGGSAGEIARSPGYDAIPPAIARSASILLHASAHAFRLRDLALTRPLQILRLDPDSVYAEMHRQLCWDTRADDDDNPNPEVEIAMIEEMLRQEAILDAADFHLLYKGANIVALAVDWAMAECDGTHAREGAIARARGEAPKDSTGAVIDAAALDSTIAALNRVDAGVRPARRCRRSRSLCRRDGECEVPMVRYPPEAAQSLSGTRLRAVGGHGRRPFLGRRCRYSG